MGWKYEQRGARGMVDRDDLSQAGLIAVVSSRRRFDPSRGTSFRTFALNRARGAMIDEMREADHVPRGERARARRQGRECHQMLSMQRSPCDLVPRDFKDTKIRPTVERAEASDLWRDLARILHVRQAEIVRRYFRGGETLKEIGKAIGISESRACQLFHAGLQRLRLRWGDLNLPD